MMAEGLLGWYLKLNRDLLKRGSEEEEEDSSCRIR